MNVLQRLRLIETLPAGASLPPEIMGNEKSAEAAMAKLCGDAAYEIHALQSLNYNLMRSISDLMKSSSRK